MNFFGFVKVNENIYIVITRSRTIHAFVLRSLVRTVCAHAYNRKLCLKRLLLLYCVSTAVHRQQLNPLVHTQSHSLLIGRL